MRSRQARYVASSGQTFSSSFARAKRLCQASFVGGEGKASGIRRWAAAKYRPEQIRLLLVAEAPPAALDRYFYFERVTDQDSLFRYVVSTVLGIQPNRVSKPQELTSLREAGVFLIDLKLEPKVGDEALDSYVPDLVKRAVDLAPEHVITIKVNVCDLCQGPLAASGLDVSRERIPFPGSGQQTRFERAMRRALHSAGWSP